MAMLWCALLLTLSAEPSPAPQDALVPPARVDPSGASAGLIAESEQRILAEPPPSRAAPPPRVPWDFQTEPLYLDRITARFPLTEAEKKLLFQNGFVVASHLRQRSFSDSLHEIHTSELPVFISTDAIFQGVFRGHDAFLIALELRVLWPRLKEVLKRWEAGLPEARKQWPKSVAEDVALYVRMARLLASDEGELQPRSDLERKLLAKIRAARGLETLELFGRKRRIDFGQYQPRGHYADVKYGLADYFRAFSWLTRLELNLKSNACASSHPGPGVRTEETPREVLAALGLAELVERSGTGPDFETLDQVFGLLAGRREDVRFAELSRLRAEAGISSLSEPDAPARLSAIIGERFPRTLNFHPTPADQIVRPLPVIFTALGPRITPDASALGPLTFTMDPVGWAAVLGHRRALELQARLPGPAEAARSAALNDAAQRLRTAQFGEDLYSQWLRAILAHATPASGVLPSFAVKPAWEDFRLGTGLVAFAQLRHDYVLYGAQVEEEGGCQIPEGWVEPNLETYLALARYARAGQGVVRALEKLLGEIDLEPGYFQRMERVLLVLAALSRQELADQPLSAEGQRFLSMVSELWAVRMMYVRTARAFHDGWYYDLYYPDPGTLPDQALSESIVDLHGQREQLAYAGARAPELGIFVVDTGGAPRALVGPVARGFQAWGKRTKRLTDDAVREDPNEQRFTDAPWAVSYRPPVPPHRLEILRLDEEGRTWGAAAGLVIGRSHNGPVEVPYGTPPETEYDGPGSYQFIRQKLSGMVVFRVRGAHGELLKEERGPAKATFKIPPELFSAARLVSVEANGEVVECQVHLALASPNSSPTP
ncbi:MAG: DUF3160 domain-containing protein [Myxococcota bacterium]